MNLVITIIGAVLAIFVVIIIHEAGHFGVAKAFGVKVLRFSIGFGKPLWSYTSRKGTEYVIALLPIGGYVRMLDDREGPVPPEDAHLAFNRQKLLVRMAIVIAGPVANVLLAIVVFWVIFLQGVAYVKPVIGAVTPQSIAAQAGLQPGDTIKKINGSPTPSWQHVLVIMVKKMGGQRPLQITTEPSNHQGSQQHELSLRDWKLAGDQPNPLGSLGITPFQPEFPAIVQNTIPNSPAERGGLQPGDQIVAVNHQALADWPALADYIQKHPNQPVTLTVKKDQQSRDVTINIERFLGVQVKPPHWPTEMIEQPHYSIVTAWAPAWEQTWSLIAFNAFVLEKMFGGLISLQTLGGPITIFRSAGEASRAGLQAYLSFIGFISVTLGFVNILPIPGLDGGHFLFQVIEGIIRRPISEKYQRILLRIGIILIILLIIQGTINDIMRLL